MSHKEILTLQFGHYANFVGAHWWNVQELSFDYNSGNSEINHDVLYREGQTYKNEVTYTPRLLLADLKGGLKSFPEHGGLYDNKNAEVPVPKESVEFKKENEYKKNEFQRDLEKGMELSVIQRKNYNLDEDVNVWSDYLYSRFHPRTVNVIKEYEHDSQVPFEVYPQGTTLWGTEQFDDEFCDKIRQYLEECNNFQGFQVLLDATNAFSGLASQCIQYLQDEYERKSVLAIPVLPSHYSDYLYSSEEERHQSLIKDSVRVLNTALCLTSISEHSSLVVPLCTGSNGWRQPGPKREFNHLLYKHELPYHSSAILAAALDTVTLKYRLKSEQFSLKDLCVDLSPCGRKIAAASLCLPFSFNKGAYLLECLDNWDGPLSKSITPNCTIGTDRLLQTITLRGIPEERLKPPIAKAGTQKDLPAYKCDNIKDMLNLYLSCTNYATASNTTVSASGLCVKTPFPRIFDPSVGPDGNITADLRPSDTGVDSVPVLAGLHSGSPIGNMLESLHTESAKIKFKRFHQFKEAGLENDEVVVCLDKLFELRECYEDNYNI